MVENIAIGCVILFSLVQLMAMIAIVGSITKLTEVMKGTNRLIDKYVEAYTNFSEDWRKSWFDDDNSQN